MSTRSLQEQLQVRGNCSLFVSYGSYLCKNADIGKYLSVFVSAHLL